MEFIFHLWEGDQKTVKKFRQLGVFFMKMKFIFHVFFKRNNTLIINQLKQKTQQKTIIRVAWKCHFCDLVQTINENIISIFIENEITKP
ncbi:hypothetical protein EI265_07715 [Salmonella enterica]|uniref:Uncharacterized protein n=2 Tax=Salmonella enterica subsp. enterica serovar Cubana TaxID=189201 RepID=V7ISH0_SALET|nr:hypothetical protein CFSAN002050_05560 [Salmonella enterica subsp. enterica serovar Cubana str. CFSAN002050]EAA4495264.1 hypothetical protein [Salmonella enterica subsp. enterica serovar Cubana]EAA7407815.1 hypothetical protein [Salmonella enterica subsp. enterica]EAA7870007.1 hypothetical protein [Salmonella enterica]EBD0148204.1 hypothetical protein [Salmonella enterica subsp. enterica serovar Coeln]EBF2798140.1 hypothetical protein [Salmonella enterica subsp. enterica serovar Altona]ESJ